MKTNALQQLELFGQSFWLDYIRRDLITTGELRRMIEDDGLRGMTSNPALFEKAIAGSHDYEADIFALALAGKSAHDIYETLCLGDVQRAADTFRPLYEQTDGRDGYVSLEVNPHLAHDTNGTLAEARRLWTALKRPNVFIKVPTTREGLPVIRQLISEGINVNATLLFGVARYREVAEAYISGLEARRAAGEDLDRVASVASFFVSRIDTLVDVLLDAIRQRGGQAVDLAEGLRGQVAVASAKVAYQAFKEIFGTERFLALQDVGARLQRLLWASTGTKNPDYSDVKYVEALVGPHTVTTLPIETLNAFRDHGVPWASLEKESVVAAHVLRQLPGLGISLDKVTQQLEVEGVEKFTQSFDKLLETLTRSHSRAA